MKKRAKGRFFILSMRPGERKKKVVRKVKKKKGG